MEDDFVVIGQVLKGDTEKFGHLVEKYQQKVFTVCMGFVHSTEDSNDLTQDAFINAFQNLKSFKQQSAFSTWLLGIAVNLSLNFLRKKKKHSFEFFNNWLSTDNPEKHEIADDWFQNPESVLVSTEMEQLVQKELSKLSENQQTAFVLSRYEHLPQREIAQIMQLSEGAVESLIQRAKANIIKKLSGYLKK